MATVRVLTAKFLFFFIYKESMAEILRLQCETYANFSVVHQNTRLHNHRFEPPLDTDTEMCQVECGMDPKCKSINVNEDEFICEINDISAADPKDQTNAVQETGWTFYSPSYTDRLVYLISRILDPFYLVYELLLPIIYHDTCLVYIV